MEKSINIYHWASQGGLVGLHDWLRLGGGGGGLRGHILCVHLLEGVLSKLWCLCHFRLYLSRCQELEYCGLV